VGVLSADAAIRKLPHTILALVSQRFEPGGVRCSARPHTIRRPGLALGEGAATRVGFVGTETGHFQDMSLPVVSLLGASSPVRLFSNFLLCIL